MAKRILAKCGRKKAGFGAEAAAIMASAAMNVAAQSAASIMNSNATKEAARKQAESITASANQQAASIKEQNEKLNEQRKESQDFVKQQNDENRQIQKDIQMQLAMLTGQQNVNDRLEASKIVVKNGGSTKPRYSLRGNNMPFKVTDGGYVVPVGNTPEGYNLFEIRGNDHEHYHKAPGGKYKTGVGIKFADGNVIEGEGNQNTNQGEYMLQTPDAAYFISKNNIAGFNPAKAVNMGMHPLTAYNIQERQKQINGIPDDGKKKSSPVESNKKLAGGFIPNIYTMYNQTAPKLDSDIAGASSAGVVYASQNENQMKCGGKKRTLKCGGKVRKKANDGYLKLFVPDYNLNSTKGFTSIDTIGQNMLNPTLTKPSFFLNNGSTNTGTSNNEAAITKSSNSFWNNIGADLIGAGISSLGNLAGAWITSGANKYASNKLAEAYNQAANITADAYRSLQTIDPNSIKREDFRAAHAMPALQAPISQAAPQIAIANRQLQRRLSNASKYSASSAAAQDRMSSAEIDAQDIKNKIYFADQEQMQKIRQANADRVTQAAMLNAELDTVANKQYSSAYLNLLQYNNDIENQKILGSAGALSDGATSAAGAIANAHTANATAWNNAILNSGQSFANTLSSMATRKADLEKVMLGASGDTRSLYYANNGSYNDAKSYYDNLVRQYKLIENSTKPEDQDTKAYLKRLINTVATGKNFKTY